MFAQLRKRGGEKKGGSLIKRDTDKCFGVLLLRTGGTKATMGNQCPYGEAPKCRMGCSGRKKGGRIREK